MALERVAVERVLAHLQFDGFAVTEAWSPEADEARARALGRSGRPELAMLIDGRDAAIDVTRFLTTVDGEASSRALRVVDQVEAEIRTAGLTVEPLTVLVYDPAALAAIDAGPLEADVRTIADAVLSVARGPELVHQLNIEWPDLPAWISRLRLTTIGRPPGRLTVYARPARVAGHVDGILEEIRKSKGRQLAAWGLGIVAILWSPDERMAAVAKGLAARDDWPFWRVYWIGPGDAQLIWSHDAGDAHHESQPTPAGGR